MMDYKHMAVLCLPVCISACTSAETGSSTRPNILLIITDQQSLNMMSSVSGDRYFSTPNMDFLADNGYSFRQGYCTYPLSVPSRVAMFTGQYPATFGIRKNHKIEEMGEVNVPAIEAYYPNMLGTLFSEAGYEVFYGGKSHLTTRDGNNTGNTAPYGFPKRFCRDEHSILGTETARLLDSLSRNHSRPFFMVASFINPHDICDYHVLIKPEGDKEREKKLPGMTATLSYIDDITSRYDEKELYENILPPVPENSALTADAPEAAIPAPKTKYTDKDWQMHNWIYGKLTEDVDNDISPIIETVRKRKLLENTIVIFVSDHGELQGAHRREMKMAPYQEAQLVPLIFAGQGIRKMAADTVNMVNTGIDLLPTLCDFAGIETSASLPGRSLKPLLTGQTEDLGREYIFCEGPNWYQVVWKGQYKYTVFEAPGHPDMLIDLTEDPGEMQNLSNMPDYEDLCSSLNKILMDQLNKRNIVLRDNIRRPTR